MKEQTFDPDETSLRVLRLLRTYRRSPLEGDRCAAGRPCGACQDEHLGSIARFVRRGEPIQFALPAFPSKSPNTKKVLGDLPDLGERLALSFLHRLCCHIQDIYPPGARMLLCSDGRVFSDVVGVSDEQVSSYQRGIAGEIERLNAHTITLFSLDEVDLRARSWDESRSHFVAEYGEDMAEIRREIKSDPDALRMYQGITRFLVEDAGDFTGTRSALQRECRKRAYELIRRSRAWGSLVGAHFPDAIRLSIHPQSCGSQKLGIRLLENAGGWLTPWHNVIVDQAGRFVLMKRAEAEEAGAELVYAQGRPSHYVSPEPVSPEPVAA